MRRVGVCVGVELVCQFCGSCIVVSMFFFFFGGGVGVELHSFFT